MSEKENKKSIGLLAATIFFGVSTIALGATLAVKIANDDTGSAGIEDKTDQKCAVTFKDIEVPAGNEYAEVISKQDEIAYVRGIVDGVAREYALFFNKIDNIEDGFWSRYDQSSAYDFTVDAGGVAVALDNGVYTAVDTTYGLAVSRGHFEDAMEHEKELIALVDNVMTERGFSVTEETVGVSKKYEKEDYICTLTGGYRFDCASKNWISEENIELVKELYSAYKAKDKDGKLSSLTAKVKYIKDSNTDGYQAVWANGGYGISGAAYLFYRSTSDNEWKFFTGTQGVISCDKFDAETSAAFKGMACSVPDGSLSTVGE